MMKFEVVKVVCDDTNNTEEDRANNRINIDVWLGMSVDTITITIPGGNNEARGNRVLHTVR